MRRVVAGHPARPMERPRPERLAANVQNRGELRMGSVRRIAVSQREKGAQENVAGGGPAGEFLRCIRAGAQL